MTDVTGFGLLGHLTEMCEGSKLSAVVDFGIVPTLSMIQGYLEQNSIPGGTLRNWESYGHNVELNNDTHKHILCDPQTSGGLLVAVNPQGIREFERCVGQDGLSLNRIGELLPAGDGPTLLLS